MQQSALIAGSARRFADSRAANYFLDQITFFIDVNLRFIWSAEKIVVIAHHFLVSADQHKGEIIRFFGVELMQLKYLLYVVQIDELIDHPIRVAGDVTQRRELGRRSVQVLNGHDREQLIERPVIGHRLKDREVSEILCA